MLAKLIIGTAIFLFGLGAIHEVLALVANSEVAPTPNAIVQSGPSSVVTPTVTSRFVVYDYAVIVCIDGSDVIIDKTEPALLVTCE